MKLKYLQTEKKNDDTILISKNGVIRFRSVIAQNYKFQRTDKWLLAVDEEEKPIKRIFVIKANSAEASFARKMSIINNTWNLNSMEVLSIINIYQSIKCKYSIFNENEKVGFCLELPE